MEGVAVGEAVAATALAIIVIASTKSSMKEARSAGSRHPLLLNPSLSTNNSVNTSIRRPSRWKMMLMVMTVERPGSGTPTPDCLGN